MKIKRKVITGILMAVVFFGVLSFAVKAYANNKQSREYKEMIETQELNYKRHVKSYLREKGFPNAGVNLMRLYDVNEGISYKMVVNHYSFEYATEEKLAGMTDEMEYFEDFPLDGNISVEFSY